MPNLDLRSVVLLVGVMGLLMSVIIFFLRRSLPSSIMGLREWAAAPAIILGSMVLLALRGNIPDFFSVLCGNLLLLGGCVLFHIGAERFFGVATQKRLRFWLFASILSALAIAWCSLVEPDYGVRLRVMAALMFGIFASLSLLVHRHGGKAFSGRFTTIVLVVQSVVILLRFVATFIWPSGSGLFEPFIYQTLYIASFAFTMLLMTVGTVLLANDRMRMEFQSIIAERKSVEMSLRESEERWKFALEGAGDGVWDWNLNTGTATYSRRWKEMLGWAESEIANHSEEWTKRVNPEDLPGVTARIQEHLDGRTTTAVVEFRMLAKDGTWKWILGRGMVVARDAEGKPARLIGTNTDITERKRAEQELRDSEMRFRAIIEASPVPLALNDERQQIAYLNLSFVRTFGYTLEDIPTLADWWPRAYPDPDYRQTVATRWQAHMEDARRKNAPFEPMEVNIRCKDGAVRTALVGAGAIGTTLQGFHLVTFYDITERKQAEAAREQLASQLRESQKMEALGTLAGGVAHDFNNALAAIIGNVELARQDVGAGHTALVSLDEVDKASRRAKDLVQQILAFGRRQSLERKATSLALVVVETARLVRATLPATVSLSVECKPDAPAVLADATQVKQILLNLCANALHAVEGSVHQGVIEIRLDAYDHEQGEARGDLRPGRYACLTVKDNGSGMDEATRARVFEPFFTTKPKGKGTGLGLAVVHGIAQSHEASIDLESVPGGGSSFRIYFPAIETPVPGVAACGDERTPARGLGAHVLYIDDEQAIVFLMKRLLERQGYRVSGYNDPLEAVAAVRADAGGFDLVVTDYNMPGMSGLAVASALREIRADLPVVLASGYITEELRKSAPAAGVRELIYKPNTVDELFEAVARFANAQSGKKNDS